MRHVRAGFWVALAWLVWGLFRASQQIVVNAILDRRGNAPDAILLASLLLAACWGAVTPPILAAARRVAPGTRIRPAAVLALLPIGLAASVVVAAAYTAGCQVLELLPREVPFLELARRILFGRLPFHLATCATIVGVDVFWRAFQGWRRAELEAARLETQLAEARIETLKTHLNPPFFFSTLSTILPLIEKSPDAAADLVVKLGDLLRMTFKSEGRERIPVADELSLLSLYLEIERVRFPDRLRVTVGADPNAADALIPTLVTQPLAEAVLAHGVSRRVIPASIAVSAHVDDGRLRVSVRDDAPGSDPPLERPAEEPRAFTEVRERVGHLYGGSGALDWTVLSPGGGLAATLAIPASYSRPSDVLRRASP